MEQSNVYLSLFIPLFAAWQLDVSSNSSITLEAATATGWPMVLYQITHSFPVSVKIKNVSYENTYNILTQ